MRKLLTYMIVAIAIVILGYFLSDSYTTKKNQDVLAKDYKDAEYIIEGRRTKLKGGVSEEAIPDSASKITTRYFGNELRYDLDSNGREDVVFLLTQETSGSGIFYYIVAALNTENGYVGSDGFLLGDRIAPQTTELSQNPRHKDVIVVNYADRAPGDPMATKPSVGKSVYLKIDRTNMRWGIVVPDFEGEENIVGEFWGTIMGTVLLGPTCPVMKDPPDPACSDKLYETSLALTTVDGARVIKTFSSDAEGKFNIEASPGQYIIRSVAATNVLPYCQSNGPFEVLINGSVKVTISCDTGIR